MLNTLTNHGFFPHSGKNFTKEITISALKRSLFLNESLSEFLYNAAIKTNPLPNATTFSLETLRTHDILEHDASLSRADAYWGNDYAFNRTVYEQTKSYWTASPITVQMAANARAARVATSNATNPTFGLTPTGLSFGFGETAAYILGLGDRVKGEVRRDVVEYLFGKLGLTSTRCEICTLRLEDMRLMVMRDQKTNASRLRSAGRRPRRSSPCRT
jgi:hypothetical protein